MNDPHSLQDNSTRSPVRAWLLGVAVLLLVRLVGGFVPLAGDTGWLWITRIGEAWLVAGLLVLGLGDLPLGEAARDIGRGRVAVVGAIVALLFFGQLVETGAGTYPFVQWNMYTARESEATYTRVDMVFAGDATEELPLRDEAKISKEPRMITGRLQDLAEAAEAGDQEAAALLEDTAQVLARMSAPPLPDSVEVQRCAVTEPSSESPAECRTLATIPVENRP